MIKIIQHRKWFFILSGALIALSVVFLVLWGLRLGIDFTGGSLVEVVFHDVHINETQNIKDTLINANFEVGSVQPSGENTYLIRLSPLSEPDHQRVLQTLRTNLAPNTGNGSTTTASLQELRFESIGPTIGNELKNKAILAVILAMGAIILYIAWAFRKVSRPVASWKYGVGAVIALIHDVLITVGTFALFGKVAGIEIDALFVSAILTVLGFSVHDTIVVYDRTRENLFTSQREDFVETVNRSVNETLTRSINTSMTTILVLLTLFIFGGDSIKNFALALIIGIIIGTYSSIFIASPLLIVWQRLSKR